MLGATRSAGLFSTARQPVPVERWITKSKLIDVREVRGRLATTLLTMTATAVRITRLTAVALHWKIPMRQIRLYLSEGKGFAPFLMDREQSQQTHYRNPRVRKIISRHWRLKQLQFLKL